MYLGRVIGRVVATRRLPGLLGEKFLIVQPLDETSERAGDSVVACDVVDSGLGDVVHVCDGRESSLALADPFVPVDATIVGHVEAFDHDEGAGAGDHRAGGGADGPTVGRTSRGPRGGAR